MTQDIFSQEGWLQLGFGGASLFILLIFVCLYMRNSNRNIDNLCKKIDRLVDSNSESNKMLATTLTQWNIEQKNNTQYLEQIAKNTIDTSSKIDAMHGKLDAILSIKCIPTTMEH